MKKIFYKISSFLMALLVFVSSLSFTIKSHYCGDILVDTSVFGKVESCGMEVQQKPSSKEDDITKKKCCDDKQLAIEGQNELQLQVDKISFEQQVFIASFVYTYINLFEGLDNNVSTNGAYEPPLVIRHIYKLNETYLI